MGETRETIPAIKLITPKAVATPDSDLYFGMSFCLLTLSNPKVNPHEKRIKLAKKGFPVIEKRIIASDVAEIWKAKEISPPYLSTILPLGKCPINMPSRCKPKIKLMVGKENISILLV